MAFLGLIGGSKGHQDDFTVLTGLRGPSIDRSVADTLKGLVDPIPVQERENGDGGLRSMTMSRTKFRQKLIADSALRKAFRNMPFNVQDFRMKGGKNSDIMPAAAYVTDVKNNALGFSSARSALPSRWSAEAITEWAEEWGQFRIPVLLLLGIALVMTYGAWRLGSYAIGVFEEQNTLMSDASSSSEGLDRAIKARSGNIAPTTAAPTTAQQGQPREKSALEPQGQSRSGKEQ